MPAHIRTLLTATSLIIPVRDAKLVLGTWQGVYLYEHRTAPHDRRLVVTVSGARAR
jgi:secondary thiamine-phosphate synthase enzyme